MAKEIKVISGSGTSTLYTCPAGRVAKITVTAASSIGSMGGTYITIGNSTNSYSSGVSAGLMKTDIVYINGYASTNPYAALAASNDHFFLSASFVVYAPGSNEYPKLFNKVQYLAAGGTFTIANAAVTIMVVEEY